MVRTHINLVSKITKSYSLKLYQHKNTRVVCCFRSTRLSMARKETGIQFLARLGTRPSVEDLEPKLFENGPSCKDVIEFYGIEGSGKTEALLHIVANCILSEEWKTITLGGKDAGVIFLDTDYKFSVLRLAIILEQRVIDKCRQSCPEVTIDRSELESYIKHCLSRVHVVRCHDSTQMVVTLHSLESHVCEQADVSVIMVDSLSSFYWIDRMNGGENISSQEQNLKLAVDALMKLVTNYNLILIVTKAAFYRKKITLDQKMASNSAGDKISGVDFDAEHSEFLCKAWQRFVTHRLVFMKQTDPSSNSPSFVVGGDYLSNPSTFSISNAGLVFR